MRPAGGDERPAAAPRPRPRPSFPTHAAGRPSPQAPRLPHQAAGRECRPSGRGIVPPMSPPVLQAPPSKSLTHRALLLAALSDAPSVVHNPGLGADNRSTLGALAAWGARFEIDERGPVPCVRFEPFEPRAPEAALDCGNSGTTLRFLLGQAARFPFETTLTGDESLQTRPNGPLLAALLDLGATVDSRDTRAPVTICGPLLAGDMTLRGGLSSQFASSLMLALALSRGPAALRLLPPIASRPYLDLTLAVADDFRLGFEVEDTSEGGLLVKIPGGRRPRGRESVSYTHLTLPTKA